MSLPAYRVPALTLLTVVIISCSRSGGEIPLALPQDEPPPEREQANIKVASNIRTGMRHTGKLIVRLRDRVRRGKADIELLSAVALQVNQ